MFIKKRTWMLWKQKIKRTESIQEHGKPAAKTQPTRPRQLIKPRAGTLRAPILQASVAISLSLSCSSIFDNPRMPIQWRRFRKLKPFTAKEMRRPAVGLGCLSCLNLRLLMQMQASATRAICTASVSASPCPAKGKTVTQGIQQ